MGDLVILRLPAVQLKTGLSRSTIYRLEADGEFPKRIRLGKNSVGWALAEVDEYLGNLSRASDAKLA